MLKTSPRLPDGMPLAFQISFYFAVTAPTARKQEGEDFDFQRRFRVRLPIIYSQKDFQKHFFHKCF